MLRPSWWFATGQKTLCYDQVYDLLLGRTLCLRPSWLFVTGQNAVCYDQVYDLFLFRTPYVTISNSYILIDCCVHIVFDQVYDLLLVRTLCLRPSIWFVTGQHTLCYDQVYDLLLVKTLYVTTKFMICFFSERHMLW